jgi:hypothetical protein
MNLEQIEMRIAEVTASYQRQLTLSGKSGYDHSLTEFLKKDLDWLREQKDNPPATALVANEGK